MFSLIYKDLIVQKKTVVFGAVYSSVFFIMFGLLPESFPAGFIYFFSPLIVTAMLIFGAYTADKNDTSIFMLSLPFTRRDIVTAKYISVYIYGAFAILTTAAIGAFFRISPFKYVDSFYSIKDVVRVLIGISLFTAIIPVYFKFGYIIVRTALMAGLFALVFLNVIAFIVVRFFNGSGFIDIVIETIKNTSPRLIYLVLGASSLAVLAGSFMLSLYIYGKKDL